MSIVLVFGNKKVSCVALDIKGKEVIIKDSASNDVDDLPKVLSSSDNAKKLLQSLFGNESNIKEANQHKLYYAFSFGSGLAYKTWQAAPSSFFDVTDKTASEKEERVLSLALENIPEGFVDLYKEARASIVNCYEDDNLFTVTSAYIPAIVDNLLEASESLGFNVFGISDIASSLYKLIDCSDSQYLVQADEITVVVNQCGCLPIILPGGYGDAIADIVYGMVEKFYPVQNSRNVSKIVSISDPNIVSCLQLPLYGVNKQNVEAAVIAAGCIADDKLLKAAKATADKKTNVVEIKEGGGKGSVTSKLRKLFKKK